MFINEREKTGINILKNLDEFIDYSQIINGIHENLEHYNPTKEWNVLIVFDKMIADMEFNKNLKLVIPESFMRGKKLNMSVVFMSQSCSAPPKSIGLNAKLYFIMKIRNKRDLQQTTINLRLILTILKNYFWF